MDEYPGFSTVKTVFMKLALFFTFGVSLKQWLDKGLFDREKLLYEKLLQRKALSKVLWFTYGCRDKKIAEQLKQTHQLHMNIEVIQMPTLFSIPGGKFLYSLILPVMVKNFLKDADILMTNQMSGSWSAVIAKKLYKKVLIIRTGYVLSSFLKKRQEANLKTAVAGFIERVAYKNADTAIVASQEDKNYICLTCNIPLQKISIFENYIDVDVFKPINCEKYNDRIIFVGRLTSQKNLFSLLKAISKTSFILDIYGEGELYDELQQGAKKLNAQVNFMGVVPNSELAHIISRYRYYILPSLYEGTPKALLEAMACGLICIGTDVTGINEIITDGVNGWLAKGTDSDSIFEAIEKAKNSPGESISSSAVETIKNKFSLESIVKKYSQLLGRTENEC